MADGSGYQYKRNRYYSPSSGRFTQEDPLGLAGGLNAYGCGGGDPVSYSDPFGLCPNGTLCRFSVNVTRGWSYNAQAGAVGTPRSGVIAG